MSKEILFIIVLLILSGSCNRQLEDKEITLSIWESYNNEEHELFSKLMAEFEKKFKEKYNKYIKIKIGRVPFDGLLPKLKTATQTKTTPDICRVDVAHVVPLSYGKALFALDKIKGFPSKSINGFSEKFVRCAINSNIVEVKNNFGKWEKHLFGIPDQTTTVCLFWNKKLFKSKEKELLNANLTPDRAPKTWSEFIEYGKILTDTKRRIFAFGMQNTLWWTFPFFNTFGAEFINKGLDEKYYYKLNGENGIKAMEYKINLFRKSYVVNGENVKIEAGAWIPGAIVPNQGFINSKYAMIITGPWDIKTFMNSGIDFGISLIPEGTSAEGPSGSSSTVGGTNMVVFKSSKYPEYALELLLYIATPEYQARWCNSLGQIPILRETIDKVDSSKFPGLDIFMKQIVLAKERPQIPQYDKLEEIINPEMELALNGKKSAKEALDNAKKRIEIEILSLMNE